MNNRWAHARPAIYLYIHVRARYTALSKFMDYLTRKRLIKSAAQPGIWRATRPIVIHNNFVSAAGWRAEKSRLRVYRESMACGLVCVVCVCRWENRWAVGGRKERMEKGGSNGEGVER